MEYFNITTKKRNSIAEKQIIGCTEINVAFIKIT